MQEASECGPGDSLAVRLLVRHRRRNSSNVGTSNVDGIEHWECLKTSQGIVTAARTSSRARIPFVARVRRDSGYLDDVDQSLDHELAARKRFYFFYPCPWTTNSAPPRTKTHC